MKWAVLTKVIGDDLFLSEDLRLVPRKEAIISKPDVAERRAKRKFGDNWVRFAELIEVDWDEWSAFIGRMGGKVVTPKKREHLRKIARWKRKPKKPKQRRGPKPKVGRPKLRLHWWQKDDLAVCARGIGLANRYVRRVDRSIKLGHVRKFWNVIGNPTDKKDREGVYKCNQITGAWTQIL